MRYEGASPELTYSYSGVKLAPEPYSEVVTRLLASVQALFPEAPVGRVGPPKTLGNEVVSSCGREPENVW